MKIKSLLIGMLACTALVGCTNDEEDVLDNNQQEAGKEVAYLQVNIAAPSNSFSRGKSDGYEYGTTGENKISSADFYFYYQSGNFYARKNLKNLTGTANTNNPTENVEYLANPVLVLEEVAKGNLPYYMIVVLNDDNTNGSLTGMTMDEAIAKISSSKIAVTDNFIMSSSTFVGEAAARYCATVVYNNFVPEDGNKNNYANYETLDPETKAEIQAEAVDVYVERLAVKARLGYGEGVKKDSYELTNAPKGLTDSNNKDLKVYAKLNAWGLNATQKEEYLLKNINAEWKFGQETAPSWTIDWNNAGNFRSYWAKSPNYASETATYPVDFASVTNKGTKEGEDEEVIKDVDVPNTYTLDYVSWNELTVQTGDNSAYCRENTNDVESDYGFKTNPLSKATSILVQAILCDEGGNALDVYKWSNTLYKEADMKATLMNSANWKYYYKEEGEAEGEEEGEVKTYGISEDDLEFVNAFDGKVHLQLTENAAEKTWYSDSQATTEVTADKINEVIEDWFKTFEEVNPCEHYNNGMMYYNIPIQHLAKTEGGEGYYGVVRNHIYDVKINSVTNIGKAVRNPDEDIIPNKKDMTLYYLGAEINVLSWHMVSQDVDL